MWSNWLQRYPIGGSGAHREKNSGLNCCATKAEVSPSQLDTLGHDPIERKLLTARRSSERIPSEFLLRLGTRLLDPTSLSSSSCNPVYFSAAQFLMLQLGLLGKGVRRSATVETTRMN